MLLSCSFFFDALSLWHSATQTNGKLGNVAEVVGVAPTSEWITKSATGSPHTHTHRHTQTHTDTHRHTLSFSFCSIFLVSYCFQPVGRSGASLPLLFVPISSLSRSNRIVHRFTRRRKRLVDEIIPFCVADVQSTVDLFFFPKTKYYVNNQLARFCLYTIRKTIQVESNGAPSRHNRSLKD